MPNSLHPYWALALGCVLALVVLTLFIAVLRARKPRPKPLPIEWALTGRPVFSTDERRVYRLLREALPHHIILSKLPLVRFCQPTDPSEVRYWYELLGTTHVTFAVCSANGRVLAAVDLDVERGHSHRAQQIKQSVLSTCRVRYLRCPADRLPSVAELQLLVPHSGAAARAPEPMPPHTLHQARSSLASTVAHRRAERTALWQDSTLFQDSFFAPDSRLDGFTSSDLIGLSDRPSSSLIGGDEVAGVVVDGPGVDSRR
jgi:hypothetical protein